MVFPQLLSNLGIELFGFFMLAWASVGLSSLLDLGLGRAISHYCTYSDEVECRRLTNASLSVLAVLAVAITGLVAIMWALYPLVAPTINKQNHAATLLLVACVPLAIVSSGLRGVIEGRQLFGLAALLRGVTAPLFVAIPAAAGLFTRDPAKIAGAFLVSRLLVTMIFAACEARYANLVDLGAIHRPDRKDILQVLSYTGWISTSNLAGTALAYFDRIALATLAPLSAAAHYSAPFEVVSRLLIIPGSITTVLFPKISQHRSDPVAIKKLTGEGYRLCLALTVPPLLFCFICAKPVLSFWLGSAFGDSAAAVVLQIVAVGILFNALGHVPLAALQGMNAPRVAARIHLLELLPTSLLFFILVRKFGATGAALAWSVRAVVDFLLLHVALERSLRAGQVKPC